MHNLAFVTQIHTESLINAHSIKVDGEWNGLIALANRHASPSNLTISFLHSMSLRAIATTPHLAIQYCMQIMVHKRFNVKM